jgi:hypothetical protein
MQSSTVLPDSSGGGASSVEEQAGNMINAVSVISAASNILRNPNVFMI